MPLPWLSRFSSVCMEIENSITEILDINTRDRWKEKPRRNITKRREKNRHGIGTESSRRVRGCCEAVGRRPANHRQSVRGTGFILIGRYKSHYLTLLFAMRCAEWPSEYTLGVRISEMTVFRRRIIALTYNSYNCSSFFTFLSGWNFLGLMLFSSFKIVVYSNINLNIETYVLKKFQELLFNAIFSNLSSALGSHLNFGSAEPF